MKNLIAWIKQMFLGTAKHGLEIKKSKGLAGAYDQVKFYLENIKAAKVIATDSFFLVNKPFNSEFANLMCLVSALLVLKDSIEQRDEDLIVDHLKKTNTPCVNLDDFFFTIFRDDRERITSVAAQEMVEFFVDEAKDFVIFAQHLEKSRAGKVFSHAGEDADRHEFDDWLKLTGHKYSMAIEILKGSVIQTAELLFELSNPKT